MQNTYPPYYYLAQVAEHCPIAVSTYMLLWRERDQKNKVVIDKNTIRIDHLITLARFRNHLLLLLKEGLISIDETPNRLHVELVDWDECNLGFAC